MKSYLIGRSAECDIIITDPTVSRQHAELIAVSDTEFLLVDRQSTGGTFVLTQQQWRPTARTRVRAEDRVKFGSHETTVAQLLMAIVGRRDTKEDIAPRESTDRRGGIVERNPETGEIVVRRKH